AISSARRAGGRASGTAANAARHSLEVRLDRRRLEAILTPRSPVAELLPQRLLEDLAGGVLRQRGANLDSLGHLERSQALGRKRPQLLAIELGARFRRDHREDFLAAYLVGDADDRALKYASVGIEH